VSIPLIGTHVSGVWQPDARFVDPTGVTAILLVQAFLSVFVIERQRGMDISWRTCTLGTNLLESWGLGLSQSVARNYLVLQRPSYALRLHRTVNATAMSGHIHYQPAGRHPPQRTLESSSTVTFGPDDTNQIHAVASVALDVLPRPLTITAGSTTKTYGQTVTFAARSLQRLETNGDTVSSVTLTSAGSVRRASSSYSIVPGAATGSLTVLIIDHACEWYAEIEPPVDRAG